MHPGCPHAVSLPCSNSMRCVLRGGGGGGGGGSNRLPGLVTEQQAVEFPQVLAIVYMKMRATEFSAQPYYYDVHY